MQITEFLKSFFTIMMIYSNDFIFSKSSEKLRVRSSHTKLSALLCNPLFIPLFIQTNGQYLNCGIDCDIVFCVWSTYGKILVGAGIFPACPIT